MFSSFLYFSNFYNNGWLFRVSLFIELGGTGDLGTGEGEPLALL